MYFTRCLWQLSSLSVQERDDWQYIVGWRATYSNLFTFRFDRNTLFRFVLISRKNLVRLKCKNYRWKIFSFFFFFFTNDSLSNFSFNFSYSRSTVSEYFQFVSQDRQRSIDYDKAVHGYHLEHVVLAWCENDSDARWISFKLLSR